MTTDPNTPADETWTTERQPKGFRVSIPLAIAVVAVVAMLGVWGGAQLKGSNASATVAAAGTGRNRAGGYGVPGAAGGAGQGGAGRGGTVGTVQSVSGNTVTITDAQGATKTITLDPSTTITKSTAGSTADITTGETIVVRGTANSDGSTTAQSVTIGNGAFGGGGGFPGGGPPATTAPSGN